jgi:lipopolysaccharide assembly outer membrane protein LptD (OstA)
VLAEGHVLAMQGGSDIYTDKLFYNIKTSGAYAKNVDVLSSPWIIKGTELKKDGKKSEITDPVFTTCDMEKPHYRLQASSIYLYEGEKIECWNAVVYLGNIPVLYFPYFSQPLKGEKRPFDFKVGHNDTAGWYGEISYLLNFSKYNDMTLGFEYMEKQGPKYDLDLNYGFNKDSSGNFNGFYTEDKYSHESHWAANFTHNQAFNDATRLNLKATTLSDGNLGRDLLVPQGTDMFRHDYWANFTTAVGNHSFNISASDTEELTTNARYYTAARLLPSFNYSMTSAQILPRISYGHSFTFTRSLSTDGGGYYNDVGSFTPTLQANLLSLYFMSLAANAGMSSSWTNNSERMNGFIGGDLLNSMTAGSTANIDILPMSMLKFTANYNYAKQLNKLRGVANDGISVNNFRLETTGGGGFINFDVNTTYDFVTTTPGANPDDIRSHLSMMNMRVYTSLSDVYFSATGLYSIYSNMIKSLAFDFNVADTGPDKLWTMFARTNYINNLMDGYGIRIPAGTPDVTTFNTGFSFNFTDEFKVTVSREFDLTAKKQTNQSYSATWNLHCWEASISYSVTPLTGADGIVHDVGNFFFTIFISALPEAKFNKPDTVSPGYDYNSLLQSYQ